MSTVEGHPDRTRYRTVPPLVAAPYDLDRGKAPAWWGMVLLIFTEATFFIILLTSYWYFRFRHGHDGEDDGLDQRPRLQGQSEQLMMPASWPNPRRAAELEDQRTQDQIGGPREDRCGQAEPER